MPSLIESMDEKSKSIMSQLSESLTEEEVKAPAPPPAIDVPPAKVKKAKKSKANGAVKVEAPPALFRAKDVAFALGVKATKLRRKLRKTLYPDGVFTNYLWDESKASHLEELKKIAGYFGKSWPVAKS